MGYLTNAKSSRYTTGKGVIIQIPFVQQRRVNRFKSESAKVLYVFYLESWTLKQ